MLGAFGFASFTDPPVITNFPIFSDNFGLTDTTDLFSNHFKHHPKSKVSFGFKCNIFYSGSQLEIFENGTRYKNHRRD
jgi:hypothetical protein